MYLNVEVGAHDQTSKWTLRLAVLVTVYITIAAALIPDRFIALTAIYANKFLIVIPILFVVGAGAAAFINGRGAPLRYAIHLIRERWLTGLMVLAFFFFSLIAFNAYKLAMPTLVPYYADQWLADLDEWLHGVAPWELAHRLDSPALAFVVLNCYEILWFFQWLGMILFVALWSDRSAGIRYLWAASLTLCVLGTFMATALASVGPIFYFQFLGDHRFHGLKATLDGLELGRMVREPAAFLLHTYRSGRSDLGGGISAMPSMHVAFVTLNAYFLSSLDRRLAIAGWTFAILIFFGSVYTGWHYAVDGYVSFAMVSLFWWLTGRMMQRPAIGSLRQVFPGVGGEVFVLVALGVPDGAGTAHPLAERQALLFGRMGCEADACEQVGTRTWMFRRKEHNGNIAVWEPRKSGVLDPLANLLLRRKRIALGAYVQSWRLAPLSVPRLLEYSPGWSKRTQRFWDWVNPKAMHWLSAEQSRSHSSRARAVSTRNPFPEKALPLKYSK